MHRFLHPNFLPLKQNYRPWQSYILLSSVDVGCVSPGLLGQFPLQDCHLPLERSPRSLLSTRTVSALAMSPSSRAKPTCFLIYSDSFRFKNVTFLLNEAHVNSYLLGQFPLQECHLPLERSLRALLSTRTVSASRMSPSSSTKPT